MRLLTLGTVSGLASAVTLAVAVLASCGAKTTSDSRRCAEQSDGAWVQPASDPKCCAPPHNVFECRVDAGTGGLGCVVSGALFHDDAGAGQQFPVGCTVSLTYCNTFFEGTPQTCTCAAIVTDASPSWLCGI